MTYKEIEDKAVQSFEYETTMISDSNIVGTCELGKATIQLLNDSNEYSVFKDSWIKTIHGSLYIYNVEPVQEKVSIKLECYDIKYKLDSLYDSSLHTFPCTLKEWRNSIFNACDVKYDDSDFPNSDLELNEEPYLEEGISNRNVIQIIAQAGASAVITDCNDIFYFKWFEDTTYEVKDWIELTTEKEHTNSINCVVLGRGDVEDNVYYPENVENQHEFRIDNNYILDPQDTAGDDDLRYTTIKPIYERVNGFSYLIFNMRSQSIDNKLSIQLGQKVKFIDIWGNELEAYVMTKKINYLGGVLEKDDNYEITLSAEEISESSTNLSYSSNIKNDVLRVERKADKNSGEISDTIEKVENNVTQISNLTLKTNEISASVTDVKNESDENYNKILQTIENLLISIQNTGGSNLIKNSVMFAYDENNNPSDWEVHYGNNEQLVDFSKYASKDSRITYKFSDDTISVSGTSGTYVSLRWNIADIVKNNPDRILYFSHGGLTRSTGAGTIVQLNIEYNDGTATKYIALIDYVKNQKGYTIPSNTSNIKNVWFAIYTNNNSTASAGSLTIVKPMLAFSKSPTYNSEVQSGKLTIQSSAEALASGSLSGHVFTLSDKIVKQRISVKADTDSDEKTYYTFSTKIKKLATGTCYVKISNSNEEYIIELKEGDESFYGDYELKGLLPKDSYYDIEFYGDEATFTDNMFAVGEYKSQWSQASGEIMNTQVNINVDGVLVKSSVYAGDYTVMSPLEFAGYSNINGTTTKVFYLNKDTTLVKKLESEDEIKMTPIKIVPITSGDIQGWAFVKVGGDD